MNQTPEESYLIDIITPLVIDRNAIIVERTVDDRGVLLTLSVSKADMGRVIGRQGQTAVAVRTLLRQYGGTSKQTIAFKINEPEGAMSNQE